MQTFLMDGQTDGWTDNLITYCLHTPTVARHITTATMHDIRPFYQVVDGVISCVVHGRGVDRITGGTYDCRLSDR